MCYNLINEKYIILEKVYKEKEKYIGKKFNRLTVHDVLYIQNAKSGRIDIKAIVSCDCSPNKRYLTQLYSIITGASKSCGCHKRDVRALSKGKCLNPTKYIGKEFITNQGYALKILSVKTSHEVTAMFLNVDIPHTVTTAYANIKNGQVAYPYHKNRWGGYIGSGKYTARKNGKKCVEYTKWMGILCRCYGYTSVSKSYSGKVLVDDKWMNFQNFADWYNKNIYECKYPIEIDKDLLSLSLENPIYSEDTCVFIPKPLNSSIRYIHTKTKCELFEILDNFSDDIPNNTYSKIVESIKLSNLKEC